MAAAWWRNLCVQTSDPLGHAQNGTAPVNLLTTTPLSPGQTFTADGGVTVQVTGAVAGGFNVVINDPANALVEVPAVFELGSVPAAELVQAAGLVPKFIGPNQTNSWVSSQSPPAGHLVDRGSTVTMRLRTGPRP